MPLKIDIEGNEFEKQYIKKIFFPYERNRHEEFLDKIIIGDSKLLQRYEDINIVLCMHELDEGKLAVLQGNLYKGTLVSTEMMYIERLIKLNGTDSNLIFEIFSYDSKLKYSGIEDRTFVHSANSDGILFGYNKGNIYDRDYVLFNMVFAPKKRKENFEANLNAVNIKLYLFLLVLFVCNFLL